MARDILGSPIQRACKLLRWMEQGHQLTLPSGHVLTLIECEDDAWRLAYVGTKQRGKDGPIEEHLFPAEITVDEFIRIASALTEEEAVQIVASIVLRENARGRWRKAAA